MWLQDKQWLVGEWGQIKAFLLIIRLQSTGYACMMERAHFDTFWRLHTMQFPTAENSWKAAENGTQDGKTEIDI